MNSKGLFLCVLVCAWRGSESSVQSEFAICLKREMLNEHLDRRLFHPAGHVRGDVR